MSRAPLRTAQHLRVPMLALLVALSLAGCGLKGDLVLPDQPADEPAPAKSE